MNNNNGSSLHSDGSSEQIEFNLKYVFFKRKLHELLPASFFGSLFILALNRKPEIVGNGSKKTKNKKKTGSKVGCRWTIEAEER